MQNLRLKVILFLTLLIFSLLGSSQAVANTGSTIIILDGSGSMWGQIDGRSKIEVARDVIGTVISEFDAENALGLMAYGHRREADCADIELLVPPGPNTTEAVRERTQDVTPLGKTPVGDSIIQAAEVLEYRTEKATVVLVSDGIENCGVDLCKLAEMLQSTGLEFTSHVIGFNIDPAESAGLECLASGTGGRFFYANDADQLGAALRETVLAVDDTSGAELNGGYLQDIVVRGSDVIFLAGRDDVTVPPRGPDHDPYFLTKRHGHLDEPLAETFPPFLEVEPGSVARILDLAKGGIHFYPQAGPGWGPAGSSGTANIGSLGGISGYMGPRGALLGVFLGDESLVDTAPPQPLDFAGADPGAHYAKLAPKLGQVFYIGDGTTSEPGIFKEITAPAGATRIFLGIADAWGFNGAPGYYDDNDGEYTVRVSIDMVPTAELEPQ